MKFQSVEKLLFILHVYFESYRLIFAALFLVKTLKKKQ